MELSKINRRGFMGAVGLAAAGAATGALPPSFPSSSSSSRAAAPYAKTGPLTDWSIDDMTGAAPRYAEPIGHPQFDSFTIADTNPLDSLFLV